MNAFIAAAAQVSKLTLVTRNQDDFESSLDAIEENLCWTQSATSR